MVKQQIEQRSSLLLHPREFNRKCINLRIYFHSESLFSEHREKRGQKYERENAEKESLWGQKETIIKAGG